MSPRRAALLGCLGGVLAFLVLLAWIFATGQTFGQRCARLHTANTAAWTACVERLAHG